MITLIDFPKELVQLIVKYAVGEGDFYTLAAVVRTNKIFYHLLNSEWLKKQAPLFLWMRPENNWPWTPEEHENLRKQYYALREQNYRQLEKHINFLEGQLQERPQSAEMFLAQYCVNIQKGKEFIGETWFNRKNFPRGSFFIASLIIALGYGYWEWCYFHWRETSSMEMLFAPLMAFAYYLFYLDLVSHDASGQSALWVLLSVSWMSILTAICVLGLASEYLSNGMIISFADTLSAALLTFPLLLQLTYLLPPIEQTVWRLLIEKTSLSALPSAEKMAWSQLKNNRPIFQAQNIKTVGMLFDVLKKESQLLPRLTLWGATLREEKQVAWQALDATQGRKFLGEVSTFNRIVERTFR